MFAILDCGTTNTKCYIVSQDGAVISEKHGRFGVKDNSLKDNIDGYSQSLNRIVADCALMAGKTLEDLTGVIGFGMVSSDLGIIIVPHAIAPISLKQLQAGVYDASNKHIFGTGIPFYLIRGIKNALADDLKYSVLDVCDFMRGEETQVTGIIQKYKPVHSFNTIVLSSHLKIIHTDKEMCIDRSMTTISGQLFDCILHHTSVGKSIVIGKDSSMKMSIDEIIDLADRTSNKHGLTRSLLLPRFMETFTDMNALERRTYLDAVIALEDIKAIKDYLSEGQFSTKTYFIVGQKNRCQLFSHILKKFHSDANIVLITNSEDIREIAVIGACAIVEKF